MDRLIISAAEGGKLEKQSRFSWIERPIMTSGLFAEFAV